MADSKNKKSSKGKPSSTNTVAKNATDKPVQNAAKMTTKQTETASTTAAKAKPAPNANAKTASAANAKAAPAANAKAAPAANAKTAPVANAKTNNVKTNNVSKAKTETTKKAESTAKTVQQTPQKEKSSGNGIASLALLCALGALGLSAYNFYDQKFSPKVAQTQESLLSGVNDIKNNVTEFSGVVTSLQQDVKDFKDSQSQYITKDTLDSAVKEGVDSAVSNLPDLPSIGPKTLDDGNTATGGSSTTGGSVSPGTSGSGSQSSDGSEQSSEDPVSSESLNANGSTISSPSSSSTDNPQENSSGTATNVAEEDSAWSWGRAKQDFKQMVMGFISIKKTDQGNN